MTYNFVKQSLFAALIILLSFQTIFAQKGLYINPVFRNGIGISDQQNIPTITDASPKYTFGAQLGIGYSLNRWRLQSGIGYTRTAFGNAINNNHVDYTDYYFNHLTGTLQIGYVLRNSKRVAIVPYIGASYGFNYGLHTMTKLAGDTVIKATIDQNTFKNDYEQTCIIATAKLHFEYRFAPKAAIIIGPSFQYMLTDMYKADVINRNASMSNHTAFLDIGILWIFPDKSQSGKSRMPSLFYN